jgi:pimeloyl-ACP methyl ester carboxylesterase
MTSQASQALPVLLVPGLGLGEESWSPTVRALQGGGALHCSTTQIVLLPGYGLPDRERLNLAPQVLARTVVHDLNHGSRVVLVGLSAGCQVAVQVALQVPEIVAGLVLVGPTTDPRADTWSRLVRRWVATSPSVSCLPWSGSTDAQGW